MWFGKRNPQEQERSMDKPMRLTITESAWTAFRQHLHQCDGKERAAFMLLGRLENGDLLNYYVHRLLLVPDHRCVQQHQTIVEPDAGSILDSFRAYQQSAATAFLHAHSHPFSACAQFSGTDDHYLGEEIRGFADYLRATDNDRPFRFLRMVSGGQEGGFTGEAYDHNDKFTRRINEVRVIGRHGLRTIPCRWLQETSLDGAKVLSESDRARLDRNVNWLGEGGQSAISKTHIAFCGLGGLGAEVLKNCRGLGFKRYSLIDMDRVETSNLNRLSCGASDVGRYKVDVAKDFILAAIPDADVTVLRLPVEEEACQKALMQADFVVNALDDDSARLNVQVLAARHLLPMLDLGSGIRLKPGTREVSAMGGQATFYVPGGPCLLCQGLDPTQIVPREIRRMQRQIGYVEGTDETPVSVVTINSVIGGIASDILMKYLTGFSTAPLWVSFDLLKHEVTRLSFHRRTDCPICGENGIEGLGIEETAPLKPKSKAACGTAVAQPLVSEEEPDMAMSGCTAIAEESDESQATEQDPTNGKRPGVVAAVALAAYAQYAAWGKGIPPERGETGSVSG